MLSLALALGWFLIWCISSVIVVQNSEGGRINQFILIAVSYDKGQGTNEEGKE